jgi:hypothetical protein
MYMVQTKYVDHPCLHGMWSMELSKFGKLLVQGIVICVHHPPVKFVFYQETIGNPYGINFN